MAGYGYPYYPYQQPIYQPPMADQLAQLRQNQFQQMQQPQQFQQAQPASTSIVWVQSEAEAMTYPVAPNSAVTLWDSNFPVVYLKQADASGKPSIKIYDLVERNSRPVQAPVAPAVEYAPLSRLEALEAKIEALTAKETATKPTARKAAKEDAE